MNLINQISLNSAEQTRPVVSCRKLVAQIAQTKQAVLNEFRQTFQTNEHLLRLALNEAEAAAWQTGVPHLVFPMLATEKAQAVAAAAVCLSR